MTGRDVFQGIVPALLTPFTEGGGAVLPEKLAAHLRFLEQHHADGVLALGTNGEFSALSMDEKRLVCDTVIEHRGGMYAIVGVNVCALPDAIALAHHAEAGGADALLVAPPFYFPNVRLDGLLAYYRAIFDTVTIPIFLYNIPSFTKIAISDELLQALSEYPHLTGVKDTSFDLDTTRHYVETFPALRIYAGSDTHCAAAAAFGAVGNISASANVIPDWMGEARRLALAGADHAAAQERVDAFHAACNAYPPRAALKHLLECRGGPGSDVRPPLSSVTPADRAALDTQATRLGLHP